eukprot:15868801-Heterocapsa_arctica.AAC.1
MGACASRCSPLVAACWHSAGVATQWSGFGGGVRLWARSVPLVPTPLFLATSRLLRTSLRATAG